MIREWFIVHTYSGYENKVRDNIRMRISSMEMQDRIFRIEVPTEDEVETKNGKQRIVKRKLFPGYVLVEMVMSNDTWYMVRNTPGVTGFLGSDNKPIPLTPEEVGAILGRQSLNSADRMLLSSFTVGDTVRILEGSFAGQEGQVDEVLPEQELLKVTITLSGLPTPVEVPIAEVERAL